MSLSFCIPTLSITTTENEWDRLLFYYLILILLIILTLTNKRQLDGERREECEDGDEEDEVACEDGYRDAEALFEVGRDEER